MAPPMRPNNSRGGSVSRNRRVKGGCTFRCTGCLPTHPGWIRSKSGSVCCSANICSLITFPARMPSKPLSESISPITIKRPSRSTGPTPLRSLNRKSVRIYDSVYLDMVLGMQCYLYGAHEEDVLGGTPGQIIAKRDGAICRATGDGAIWITHMKQKGTDGEPSFKLPVRQVLGDCLADVPDVRLAIDQAYDGRTYREIWYEERQAVGYLHFDCYNGAMSTEQCQRLREALLLIRRRPTKVIVLMGGTDFWSNGIHLNMIEAADDPAHESWRNIQAMNDLVRELITTESHLVNSALQGNAAAGGVILALAADCVYARKGIVLNPHYKGMGNRYGSEYWTYLFPKRVGGEKARELTEALLPISTRTAQQMGLLDDAFEEDAASFREHIRELAEELASSH